MSTEDIAIWDAEAATFDEEADHGLRDPAVRSAWRELLLDVLPAAPGRIADLGCGTGTLSLLLADAGYSLGGVDFSPAMIERARLKAGDRCEFSVGDASAPDLEQATYDVVLCRHVLWALPAPVDALRRWVDLLAPDGRLVLIEGSWSTGAGLTAEQTSALLAQVGREGVVRPLPEAAYWGGEITDERYLITA